MNKPRLGQHFLVDKNYLKPMLEAAELEPGDAVIEVGPGKGVLTHALLSRGAYVLALELDERLFLRMQEKLGQESRFQGMKLDARRADWPSLIAGLRAKGFSRIKLVSNLPYYLATQMVIQAIAIPDGFERLVVMVQNEVAKRMCASPGGKDYSSYSVAMQYYGEPQYVTKVPPRAFNPPPRVNSAIVRVDRRTTPPVMLKDPDRFFYLVQAMFTHRRKTLRKSFQGTLGAPELPVWEAALAASGLDPKARPETLSLAQMADLLNRLA